MRHSAKYYRTCINKLNHLENFSFLLFQFIKNPTNRCHQTCCSEGTSPKRISALTTDDKCSSCPPAVRTSHWFGKQNNSRLAQQDCCFLFMPAVRGIKWHFYSTETLTANNTELECAMWPKLMAMGQRDIKV